MQSKILLYNYNISNLPIVAPIGQINAGKSSVCNISVFFNTTLAAGTNIEIRNQSGEVVLSHTSAKIFNHLATGSSAFNLGETYTIYINGEEYQSFTISEVTTTLGNIHSTPASTSNPAKNCSL